MLLSAISQAQPNSLQLEDNTLLLTFRYVMKELSSKQLPNDRKMFTQLCQNSFDMCLQVWEQHYNLVIESIKNCSIIEEEQCLFYIQKLINILKTFRTMPLVLNESNFNKLFDALIVSIQTLLNCVKLVPKEWTSVSNAFHKLLLIHSKIFLDSIDLQIPLAAKFSNSIASFNRQCIFAYSDNRDIFQERFIVNCINILKALLCQTLYNVNTLQNDELQNLLR